MSRSIATVTLCLFAFAGIGSVGAMQKHRVTFNDLQTFKSAAQLKLSPDGKLLAYSVWSTPSELWLVSTRQGSTPRKIDNGQTPDWSPDGRYLSYYSSRSGTLQLWLYDTRSGQSRRISNLPGGVDSDPATRFVGWVYDPLRYSWSADGTKIVFSSRVPGSTAQKSIAAIPAEPTGAGAPLVLNANTPPEWTTAGVFAHGTGIPQLKNNRLTYGTATQSRPLLDQLFITDVRTGETKQLTHDDFGYFAPMFSPKNNLIAFATNEGRAKTGWDVAGANIYTLDPATGARRALTSGPQVKTMPKWSPDGNSVFFETMGDDKSMLGMEGISVVPAGGGKILDVTRRVNHMISLFDVYPTGNAIVVTYQDGVTNPVSSVTTTDGTSRVIGANEATAGYVTVSRSGAIAWSQDEPAHPALMYFKRSLAAPAAMVVDLNPEVNSWELGHQEIVRWRDKNGDQKEGVLIEPVGYQKGKRYPLIVDGYPGQGNSFKSSTMMGNQAWASMGYAVFLPAPRGPHVWENISKNPEFDYKGKGPKGIDVLVDDVTSGVQQVVRQGVADPNRMCIYGFSNGGGVVDQTITKSHIFKCAVSVAGALAADWSMPYFIDTNSEMLADIAGVTPFDDPSAWVKLSAVYRLKNVTTPVLLADGDNDSGFLWGCIEMYNGLRYLHKSVTFLRYPNQEHGFEGAAMKDFWNREMAFFAKYLHPSL